MQFNSMQSGVFGTVLLLMIASTVYDAVCNACDREYFKVRIQWCDLWFCSDYFYFISRIEISSICDIFRHYQFHAIVSTWKSKITQYHPLFRRNTCSVHDVGGFCTQQWQIYDAASARKRKIYRGTDSIDVNQVRLVQLIIYSTVFAHIRRYILL